MESPSCRVRVFVQSRPTAVTNDNHTGLDYFNTVNQKPNVQERKAVLEQIKKVPGCDWYSLVNVNNWFKTAQKHAEGVKNEKEKKPHKAKSKQEVAASIRA